MKSLMDTQVALSELKPDWPLHGRFLYFHLLLATGELTQKDVAREVFQVSASSLNGWLHDERKLLEKRLQQAALYIVNYDDRITSANSFKVAFHFLRKCHAQGIVYNDVEVIPELAEKFLRLQRLPTRLGEAFPNLETSPALAKGIPAQDVDVKGDATSRSTEGSRQHEPYRNERSEASNVGTSLQSRNHVEKICYMGPIEVRQGDDEVLHIGLDVNLGEESKHFEDLVVTAGFQKLRVKVNLEGLREVRSLHRDGKLRGRIAIDNRNEVFIVEETYFGRPSPFLKDTVFEGASLYSARFSERRVPAKVDVVCFIAFSDFELEVFDADGDQVSDFTDRQQNLRKIALKEFIKTRCRIRGFEGTVSEAEWVGDVEA